MIKRLKEINSLLIENNFNNDIVLKKQKLIQQILKDDKCFYKINIKTAYAILKDLEIDQKNIKKIYLELIDSKNY